MLAMPVEKSGQDEFDFQYGADFGEHIDKYDVDFAKVLVRYNPEGDAEMNERQLGRLKELADWLHANDRKFLFELLVPAEPAQLESVGGDTDRYDAELRPELMKQAIKDIQDFGIEVDIWKIEGVDAREDAEALAAADAHGRGPRGRRLRAARAAARPTRRSTTGCAQAAPVEGFVGFAIGRSIWWDALKGFLDGRPRRARPRRSRSPTTTCASSRSTTTRSPARASEARRPSRRPRCSRPPRSPGAARTVTSATARRSTGRVVRVPTATRSACGWPPGARSACATSASTRRRRPSPARRRSASPTAPRRSTRGWSTGATVRLERDVEERDRYGRLLAYVYAGETLRQRGAAPRAATPQPLDGAAQRAAARSASAGWPREARRAGSGLWASCAS